jgi:hypothetical protein
MSRTSFILAGFLVTIIGRFWLTAAEARFRRSGTSHNIALWWNAVREAQIDDIKPPEDLGKLRRR